MKNAIERQTLFSEQDLVFVTTRALEISINCNPNLPALDGIIVILQIETDENH